MLVVTKREGRPVSSTCFSFPLKVNATECTGIIFNAELKLDLSSVQELSEHDEVTTELRTEVCSEDFGTVRNGLHEIRTDAIGLNGFSEGCSMRIPLPGAVLYLSWTG